MTAQSVSDFKRLASIMIARSRELRLGQSAASLSFISLLALVPLLTVILATLTSFQIFGAIREAIQLLLVQNLLPEGFAVLIFRYLNQFISKAQALSAFGLVFLLLTATAMMLTLDRTLNLLWRVEKPRPLIHRVSIYWLALLLGPILAGAGAALAIFLAGGKRAMAAGLLGFEWWDLMNLVLTTGAFSLCYRWIPNATVAWRDALIGGVSGAVVSELARSVFVGYLGAVPTYQQVYGALAAIPALLIWAYISWWVFLLGALLTSVLPEWRSAGASISPVSGTRPDGAQRGVR